MTTEPRQVEVVCGCKAPRYCSCCMGTGKDVRLAAPSSLTARMLDLAEAVMEWENQFSSEPLWYAVAHDKFLDEVRAKIAAVRAHKDYKGVAP